MRLRRSLISCAVGAYRALMPTPNEERDAWLIALRRKKFLEAAETRVGTVGALLEVRDAALFRVDSYSVDDWGVRIGITHVPMPGFGPGPTAPSVITCCWDALSTLPERWQARYCWKFMFGTV